MYDEAPRTKSVSGKYIVSTCNYCTYDYFYCRTVTAEVEGSSPFQVAIKSLSLPYLQ